jgi:hypothetical protein
MGAALYGALLATMADDVAAGGLAGRILGTYAGDPASAVLSLRLLGGVHRLVLQGRAPGLAPYYDTVGGDQPPTAAWPAFQEVLEEHERELVGLLDQAPQTNEVGRATALVGGLHHIAATHGSSVRLVEIGASAGLNLWADRFRVEQEDGRHVAGPAESPVTLTRAWLGALPPGRVRPEVVERSGCDLAPLDPRTDEGRLRLRSYVWPDQPDRWQRLQGALEVAAEQPFLVEPAGAADFLDRLELRTGATTVVWHSVMWQYLPDDEKRRVTDRLNHLGAAATADAGFAHLRLEPRDGDDGPVFEIRLRHWPNGADRLLGHAAAHGVPATWTA